MSAGGRRTARVGGGSSRTARKQMQVEAMVRRVLALLPAGGTAVEFCSGCGHIGLPVAALRPALLAAVATVVLRAVATEDTQAVLMEAVAALMAALRAAVAAALMAAAALRAALRAASSQRPQGPTCI